VLMAIVGMIIITSQSPVAFAGACPDEDGDGYYPPSAPSYCAGPYDRDCDDTDPEVYPGDGTCEPKIEIISDFNGDVIVEEYQVALISSGATVDGTIEVNGGTVIISDSSTIKGNIVSNGGSILIEEGSVIEGNVDILVSGDGGILEINGGIVSGNLITNGISTLTVTGSNINGNIYSENDGVVTITENTVNGNIEIINPTVNCYESKNDVNGNNSSCHLSS